MNAGCYGREMKDILVEARAVDERGAIITLSRAAMGFSYRHSAAPGNLVFVDAVLEGTPDDRHAIRARMEKLVAEREATQPIRTKTGGSTFTNPSDAKAWQLIDQANCRGLRHGDAQVSEKHCNFLINLDQASAADIEALGEEVRRKVKINSGVDLEWENQTRGARDMTAFKRVAVLLGGRSVEREVSLVSGRACADALREEGFEIIEIDALNDVAQKLASAKPDAVFNSLHGRWGEDGCVQGLLELMRIPYTHSGVLGSAIAMNKEYAKSAFRAAGLPVAESIIAPRMEASERHLMEPPYVVKPVSEGSSVGVYIIRLGDTRPPGELGSAEWSLGEDVMIEKYVPGRELTATVMGDSALAVTEIVPKTQFYDYDAKYSPGGSKHVVPADLTENVTREIMALAERAHVALGCRGVTRADFRYDEARGEIILLEVNTQPGMTPTSLVPEQAAYKGVSFSKLVRWILEDASCDR